MSWYIERRREHLQAIAECEAFRDDLPRWVAERQEIADRIADDDRRLMARVDFLLVRRWTEYAYSHWFLRDEDVPKLDAIMDASDIFTKREWNDGAGGRIEGRAIDIPSPSGHGWSHPTSYRRRSMAAVPAIKTQAAIGMLPHMEYKVDGTHAEVTIVSREVVFSVYPK
jgi:hypothetical protein